MSGEPMREAVARVIGGQKGHPSPWPEDYATADAILALAAPAEGYVLVPVEPTEAMQNAGVDTDPFILDEGDVKHIYRAMIAACLPAGETGK